MIKFWRGLAEKWANWSGDREMEMAIRRHLSTAGYYGGSAKLRNVRLVAVARPGWVQIYRFDVTARLHQTSDEDQADPAPIDHELCGLVRDDGRRGGEVRCFRDEAERRALFARWSEGLICLRGAHGLGSN